MRRRSPRQPGEPYDIGYRKPPVATRFPKGTSGNPRGRPRGSETVDTLLAKILAHKVTVRDGNGVQKLTVLETMLRTLASSAAKGDLRAMRLERVQTPQCADTLSTVDAEESGPTALDILKERLAALAARTQDSSECPPS